MNNQFIKKWGGYVVAVVLFVALSVAFFYPIVLEDKTLVQYDIKSGIGWGKDARDYHERTGDYVHWSNMMFSGMPANYTYMPQSPNIFKSIGRVLVLDNMGNWGLLFLYMLGFYVLLISLGCSNWLSVIGAVAYAFCSYNLVIIDAGHISKGLVMATMAPIIGGVILCYRGKYIWGAIITLLFTGLNIAWAHQQITYYLLLTLVILFVVYLVYAVREKTMTQFAKSSAVLVVAAAHYGLCQRDDARRLGAESQRRRQKREFRTRTRLRVSVELRQDGDFHTSYTQLCGRQLDI